MNTVGKILVVLNFLFAVIVGVLLVYDFAARNKWKEAFESLKRESEVAQQSRTTTSRATDKILEDNKTLTADLENRTKSLKDTEDQRAALEDGYKLQIDELNKNLRDKDVTLAAAAASKQRLANEIEGLNKTIKDREVSIVKLQADIKSFQTSALNFESLAKARQVQNENLLEQIRDISAKLARSESGVNPDAAVIRNPNEPNPPTVLINGKIEKVDGDLVQLSLGTDHGLNRNNTLDVYRTNPSVKYLGMIRVVDAHDRKSVARFVVTGNQGRPQLKEGDLVTSKLSR
jgi:hypothetical protein